MRVSNVMLYVSDLERSVRFYRDELGLDLLSQGGGFAFLDGGEVTLALRQSDEPPPAGGTEVVFEVDDVWGSFNACRSRGVDFEVEPRVVTAGEGGELHAAHCIDPDGHVISISGWIGD